MAVHPLRPATDRRLGGPLPRQQANQTRAHPVPPEFFPLSHATPWSYAVLAAVSSCYPPVQGRLPTRYSPVRHSVTTSSPRRDPSWCFVRLACVRHAASVHPEPGSNSQIKRCRSRSRTTGSFPVLLLFLVELFVRSMDPSRRHHSLPDPNEIYELNVQGCFVIQLSSFCVAFSFSAKAFILYRNYFRLSRTFSFF